MKILKNPCLPLFLIKSFIFRNEKERHRKSEDFRNRSLTGVSHGNQTIDTAFSIGVLSAIGYVIIVVCGN